MASSSTNASVSTAPAGTRYGRAAARMARRARVRSAGAVPRRAILTPRVAAGSLAGGGVALRKTRDAVLRVRDALVVHAEEQLAERVLDALDVAEREVALVELAFRQTLAHDLVDHRADGVGVLRGQRTYRCLGAIGEHHDGGLLGARPRAGITELRLVGVLAALLRHLEEVLHRARPVVPGDHFADRGRKVIALGERETVLDVRGDDPRGDERVEVVVRVRAGLVLDERRRVPHLADVVVVRADPRDQGIGADDLRGTLGKV